MAESNKNMATEGLTGQIGNFVFRRRRADDKILVSHHPSAHSMPPTAIQEKNMSKFQEAVIYGKSILADAANKAAYKDKAHAGESAFNVAVADYFHAPYITEIDVTQYTGAVGSTITVGATDDFEVAKVHVHIANGDGTVVEDGDAVKNADGLHWVFTATQNNASTTGDKITVTAYDRPGNETGQDKVL